MNQTDTNIQLLLAYGDDKPEPVLKDGLPPTVIRNPPEPDAGAKPSHLRGESEAPDSLPAQRWGVIAPQGEVGDRLLAAIAPLIAARKEQQGSEVIIYRTPADAAMSMEDAQKWRESAYLELQKPPAERISEEDQPAYLMVLGDLHQVPEAIHQIQGSDCFVGRLAFSAANGDPDYSRYEAYVDKVLRWEKKPSAADKAQARFMVVRDGTAATEAGSAALIEPALQIVEKARRMGTYPAANVQAASETGLNAPADLLAQVNTQDPTAMFTVSHGAGPPRGGWINGSRQRLLQGSMSFGMEGKLSALDLGDQAFLPGGLWFMLACYGAGTPSASHFRHWLERLSKVGQFGSNVDAVLAGLPKPEDRPFIAALPQAVLANPNGPLAFIGHLDLAWTYGFQDLGSGGPVSQPTRFVSLIKSLLQRHRVGPAFREVTRYIGAANTRLAMLYNIKEATRSDKDSVDLGHFWMTRQDLMGYVLLGDPAVRLAIADAPKPQQVTTPQPTVPTVQSQPAPAPASAPTATPPATTQPAAAQPAANFSAPAQASASDFVQRPAGTPGSGTLPIDAEKLEDAIIKYQASQILSGVPSAPDIAKECGLSPRELTKWAEIYTTAGRAALTRKF